MAVVFVFLLLAALYESWILPLAVVLIVPMCILAAMIGVNMRGLDRNILVDFARPIEDLSRYKLVFAPSLHLLSGGEADRLKLYVQNGGTLVSTFNTGLVDEHNLAPDTKALRYGFGGLLCRVQWTVVYARSRMVCGLRHRIRG